MFPFRIPNVAGSERVAPGDQLPLAFERPRKPRKSQAPIRTCECGQTFRAWKKDGLCGRCPDARSRSGAAQSNVELGTADDDGSLHFFLTGERQP